MKHVNVALHLLQMMLLMLHTNDAHGDETALMLDTHGANGNVLM